MDTIFSLCHVLWPRLIVVSLVKALRIIVDLMRIWDQYSLRICIQDKNSLKGRHSLRMCIQDKNILVRTYLVNIWMGYVPREVVVFKFMPPSVDPLILIFS